MNVRKILFLLVILALFAGGIYALLNTLLKSGSSREVFLNQHHWSA